MEVKKYLPEVFTGIGIGGIFGTAAFAIEGTIKSVRDYDEAKKQLGRDLTIKETISLCWRNYIRAGVTAVSSAACIIASDVTHTKRYAAVATAWAMSDSALRDLTAKIPEIVGEEKAQDIRNAVAQETLNKMEEPPEKEKTSKAPLNYVSDALVVEDDRVLCCDLRFKRYFYSSEREIKDAEDEFNRRLSVEGDLSLNDFYTLLHMSPATGADDLGWNSAVDGYLDIRFGSAVAPGGKPCITIDYFVGPREDYASYR